ncbi:uncharacterized protein LOC133391842 [Anopheles gambiae]|uniref:uncharacterized protein LOC133391842 n=1 Tax=Anopheles gambiae TaxID=7165 RepID=UPI002AC96A4B|nr:uncharacterized protein LOC133391842 [Anopheles gambiae]
MDIFVAVKNSSDLKKLTADEEGLVRLLQEAELLPPTQQCSKCKRQMKLKVTKRSNACKWICKPTSSCTGWECTVRTDSIFKNSRLSLSQLMEITFEWSRNTTRMVAEAECAAGKTAILKWFKILREISAEYVETHQQQIGGEGLTVEINESVITKRKYHRGRIADNNQVWLVGGICRETKEIFLELVQKRDAGNLQANCVTTIVTDGWRAYIGLDGKGYEHEMINHSENFVHPSDPLVHTQTIENLWRWVKPFLRSKGTNRGALIEYIREYQLKRAQPNNFITILRAIQSVQEIE